MQERLDVRIEEDINVIVTTVYNPDGSYMPAEFQIEMKVLNISAAGLLLASEREFEENTSFFFDIQLGEEKLKVMPIVVRKFKDEATGLFNYGCKFIHLETEQEKIIRKYIFEKQLMKRRFN